MLKDLIYDPLAAAPESVQFHRLGQPPDGAAVRGRNGVDIEESAPCARRPRAPRERTYSSADVTKCISRQVREDRS
jgi:hypothetical protein